MEPISICAIMKNEEKHIKNFLDAIELNFANCPHEIVLVDTGSNDNTLKIASEYPVQICQFDWIKDFAAARNYMLSQCHYDWVLILDLDEYVKEVDITGFYAMMEQYPKEVGMLTRNNHFEMNGTDSIYTDKVERFFARNNYHYEGIIHEQVRRVDGTEYERIAIPLTVEHAGYNTSQKDLEEKANRNNELLLKMLEENPNDPYLYFQIGQSYNLLRDDEKACFYYGKGLEYDVDPALEYVQMMVIGYGYALLHLDRYEEALQFQGIYDAFDSSADFVCLMGLIYMRTNHFVQAMGEFLKATTIPTCKTEGSNSFIPLYNMGLINEMLGDPKTAMLYYKKCGDFRLAKERLQALEK